MAKEEVDGFRGGKRYARDRQYGISDKRFWRWWHRQEKDKHGGADIDKDTAWDLFEWWKKAGYPEGYSVIFRLMTTNPEFESPLVDAWLHGSEDQIVNELKNIRLGASLLDKDALSKDVLDVLQETSSSRVRNAAAITLVDLGVRQIIIKIVDVLRRKDVIHSSGTLLFALNEIEATIPLFVLMEAVEFGSFEARQQAMSFLEDGRIDDVEPSDLHNVLSHLEQLTKLDDQETAEAADFARECLSDYARDHLTQL